MQKKLTKAEEEIMQLFWSEGPNTVTELIKLLPSPKPPHSTISTFVRILEKKGFVKHKAYGRSYVYSPTITKEKYSRFSLKNLISNYFDGSANELVSFLAQEEDLSIKEISQLLDDVKKEKND